MFKIWEIFDHQRIENLHNNFKIKNPTKTYNAISPSESTEEGLDTAKNHLILLLNVCTYQHWIFSIFACLNKHKTRNAIRVPFLPFETARSNCMKTKRDNYNWFLWSKQQVNRDVFIIYQGLRTRSAYVSHHYQKKKWPYSMSFHSTPFHSAKLPSQDFSNELLRTGNRALVSRSLQACLLNLTMIIPSSSHPHVICRRKRTAIKQDTILRLPNFDRVRSFFRSFIRSFVRSFVRLFDRSWVCGIPHVIKLSKLFLI